MHYSMFVFMDKFTKPVLPPLLVEKDCGKYTIQEGINGRVYLVSGEFNDLFRFIKSHQQIWLGFHDNCSEEELNLEKWVQPQ
jgi:hypothetical protein